MRMAAVLAVAGGFVLGFLGCSDPTKDLASSDKEAVIEAVRKCGEESDDDVAKKVAAVVAHPDTLVAAEAVRSLGRMRQPTAVRVLKEVASGATEKRGAVRQEAVVQLGRQRGSPEALDTLRQVVKADPDPRVRAAAATSLSRQKSLPDVALLVEIAENEQDPIVQARAVGAVERLVGLKFGYDPKAPPAERKRALVRMRSIALTAASSLQQWHRTRGRGTN